MTAAAGLVHRVPRCVAAAAAVVVTDVTARVEGRDLDVAQRVPFIVAELGADADPFCAGRPVACLERQECD